ncbi:MAG: DinB family protein [Chitinophagaceae bacterium]|nr:DinB family protein [Chitinophagaceae bacterium]
MEFNIQSALQILERTPSVVEIMLQDLPAEWTMVNEGGDSWSAFDIVGHYIHGEKTDWIPRMHIILSKDQDQHFVSFDRFAQFKDSKGKSLGQLLNEFKELRLENIEQLKAVEFNDSLLNRTGIHPTFGSVTLRQLLAAWVIHDLTHIYQISRVMAKQYEIEAGPWKQFLGVLNDR